MATTPIKRTPHRHEKLARVYDDEILPIFGQRFGQMLLRALHIPPRAMVLEVGCTTGYVTLEVLRRLDGDSRIIAIDASSPLVDVARGKAGAEHAGKKIFFRTQPLFPRLAFAEDVYDTVFSNLALAEAPDLEAAVRDLVRVAKPGGQVAVTLPLRGTWVEFLDIFREVLQKHDKLANLRQLDDWVAALPEAETVARWMESAGLGDLKVSTERWEILFRSAREFFFAPLIEYGPLPAWKDLAGRGDEMQDVFYYIKEAIDAYFAGTAFPVSVVGGCLSGTKLASTRAAPQGPLPAAPSEPTHPEAPSPDEARPEQTRPEVATETRWPRDPE